MNQIWNNINYSYIFKPEDCQKYFGCLIKEIKILTEPKWLKSSDDFKLLQYRASRIKS